MCRVKLVYATGVSEGERERTVRSQRSCHIEAIAQKYQESFAELQEFERSLRNGPKDYAPHRVL